MKTKIGFAMYLLFMCLSFMASASAYAQSSDFDRAFAPRGVEARITLSIPFGEHKKTLKSNPQIAFVGRYYNETNGSIDWALKNAMGQENYRESRLAISFSSQPDIFLNDERLLQVLNDEAHMSDDVKTAGKVALVAGAVVVGIIGVGLALVAACHGDGEDSGC